MATFTGTYPGSGAFPGSTTFPGAPPTQTFAPPVFANNTVVPAAQIQALSQLVDNLTQITLGSNTAPKANDNTQVKSRPSVKAYLKAGQPVQNITTNQTILWDAAEVDTENAFAVGYDYVTTIVPGWYRVTAQVAFATASTDKETAANLLINGTDVYANSVASVNTSATTPGDGMRLQLAAYVHLPKLSQVYMSAYQDSGNALNLLGSGNWGTWLSLVWDAPY